MQFGSIMCINRHRQSKQDPRIKGTWQQSFPSKLHWATLVMSSQVPSPTFNVCKHCRYVCFLTTSKSYPISEFWRTIIFFFGLTFALAFQAHSFGHFRAAAVASVVKTIPRVGHIVAGPVAHPAQQSWRARRQLFRRIEARNGMEAEAIHAIAMPTQVKH